ncbi:SIMPL domain-containing protein [Terriglobus aquaticus]|uniref:SIMPL domain-containing protein n=1 Tax=Terriglobus aquaticus TaxID=940139 RepID=A0ABW9KHL2_9BACT|nr:SIMPL domain-containing protein [Terriglobus aquaticus]
MNIGHETESSHGGSRLQQQTARTSVKLAALAFVCSALALFGGSARAQSVTVDPCATAPQSCPTLVSTSATAQTRIANTAVDVTLGLTVTQTDLPAAQRSLSTQSNQLIAYLRAQGVQRLFTNNVSFSPETRFQKNAADKTVGYTGSTSVSFRTTPDKAPEILSAALNNGANTINSTVFTPTEQQMEDARRDLAAQATKSAMAEIESIAKAVNSHVVALRDIQVGAVSGGEPRPMPMMMRAMKADMPVAAPIATAEGDQQISLTVSVTAAVAK